jgi:aminoglycoside phosphotransferase (APT) family kinase protein
MAKKNTKKPNIAFAEAGNPEWLIEHLPDYFWQNGDNAPAKLTHIKIRHIWESSKRVTVLYQIDFNGSSEKTHSHTYVGYIVKKEKLAAEYEKTLKSAGAMPPIGPAVTLIPEANLVLAAYPNDRKMKLLQAKDVAFWLLRNFKKITGKPSNGVIVETGSVEPLRYVPDKRFTSRCSFTLKNSRNGADSKISFIAKQLSDEWKAKRLFNSLKLLEKAFHIGIGGKSVFSYPVRIPRALALFEEKPVVFIEEIAGENLKRKLPDLDLARSMYDAGALLANFHKADKRVHKQITRRNEIAEVRSAAFLIRKSFSQMSRHVRAFFRDFQNVDWEDGVPKVLLHGSFRLNHIFIHHDELALLDLDSIRMGHPAYDIGNFLSSLYYLDAQDRFSEDTRQAIQKHFLRGYAEHTDFTIKPKAALWFLASLLINKQAYKYVTHSHDDREEKVEAMFELARQLLHICRDVSETMPLEGVAALLPDLTGESAKVPL